MTRKVKNSRYKTKYQWLKINGINSDFKVYQIS